MILAKHLSVGLLVLSGLAVAACAEESVLYQKQSPYTLITVTENEQGLRTLFFDRTRVRQSCVKLGDPDHLEFEYARVMPAGLVWVANPRRVLVLGLGGGTIPNFLHRHFPQTVIDVVDIDPDVVDVAKRFFQFREDTTLRAYVADGRRFVEACRSPYDLIFLDAYGPDSIPYHLSTREFLQAVRRAVTPHGAVLGNVWDRSSNPLYDDMVVTYQAVFEDLLILEVPNAANQIFVALPQKTPYDRQELWQRAKKIVQEKGFRYDFSDTLWRARRPSAKQAVRGRILTDQDVQRKAG